MQIIFAVLTVIAVFLAVRIARKILRIVFVIVALIGIATTLYGEQIIYAIEQFILKR